MERTTIEISRVGRGKTGFSLLELMVVLVLIGIGGLIVLPSLQRGLKALEVRRPALELAAVARDLRSRAIRENSIQRLILNASENSYQGLPERAVFLSPGLRFSGIEGGEPLGEGVKQFLFFPTGMMFGGEIGITGGEGAKPYFIRFDPLSGRILVSQRNTQ